MDTFGTILAIIFTTGGVSAVFGVFATAWVNRKNDEKHREKTDADREKVQAEASEIFNRIATQQTEQIMRALQEERAESQRLRIQAEGLREQVEHLRNEVTALRRQLEADARERQAERNADEEQS